MRLVEALGDLVDIPQFFVWRLTWEPIKQKYHKTPYYTNVEGKGRDNWTDYQSAMALLASLRATGGTYSLGWYLTADSGYWFFDIDGCITDGVLSDVAQWAYTNLKGAFSEISASGNGLHFIGHGPVPQHGMVNKAAALELYTEGRGIAFGLTDEADGCADSLHTQAIAAVAAHWFPYVETVRVEGTDPAWRGPTDDEDLLRRALQSGSVGSLLGKQASFRDLWERNVSVLSHFYPPDPGSVDPFGGSEADGALAMHLAFWTGRDVERVERLMRRSALVRDKWDSERNDTTYLGFTVARACANASAVLQDKERAPEQPVVLRGAEGLKALSDEMNNLDLEQLDEAFIPRIKADASISMIERASIANLLKARLDGLGSNHTLAAVTKMLKPSAFVAQEVEIPAFYHEFVYVQRGDTFYHMKTGSELPRTAFKATYNRFMPVKTNGDHEDAATWCTDRWGMQTVNDTMYLPGRDATVQLGAKTYVNSYRAAECAGSYTTAGITAIQNFAHHLLHMCGERPEVYTGFIDWMAHNVQHPGVKIRYVPLVKGHQGSGKSIIGEVMQAALGWDNVKPVGSGTVMGGNFTDWAHGACVIILEEIWMEGKQRYAVANTIKENITNDRVSINRKNLTGLDILNISNFIAFTNHNDAVPLTDEDRRWWVIFSPFVNNHDQNTAMGIADRGAFYGAIKHGINHCGGEFRKWLLEHKISDSFDPNGNAPLTAEKANMRRAGEDEAMEIARRTIENGSYGVCKEVFSSSALAMAMRLEFHKAQMDEPKGRKMNWLATNLSYIAAGEVKWDGKAHTVWTIRPMRNEEIRAYLNDTKSPT